MEFKQHKCSKSYRIKVLEVYNTVSKLETFCLLESCLDSYLLSDNDDLIVKGNNLVKDDHTDDVKRGGVCAYVR